MQKMMGFFYFWELCTESFFFAFLFYREGFMLCVNGKKQTTKYPLILEWHENTVQLTAIFFGGTYVNLWSLKTKNVQYCTYLCVGVHISLFTSYILLK